MLFLRKEGIPMAGRKPKPTAIKKLEGNPGKRKLNTKGPIQAKGMPECPEWLFPEAKKEWERLADLMNQIGVFTEVDMAAFAASLMQCNPKQKCCARLHEHLTSTATTRKFVFEFMAGDVILPSKLKKPCVYPACPALVTGRYCEEHD